MMQSCWVLSIPGRSRKRRRRQQTACVVFAWLLLGLPAGAATLESLVKAYREKPSAQAWTRLEQYAAEHGGSVTGAQAQLAIATLALQEKRYETARKAAVAAARRLPVIADYCLWVQAEALLGLEQPAAAVPLLRQVVSGKPPSPHAEAAALSLARALRAMGDPRAAAQLLKARTLDSLGYRELATAYQEAGDLASAAAAWQQVHYYFPASAEAPEAVRALNRLRSLLGAGYPAPTPAMEMRRAEIWIEGREFNRAAAELAALIASYQGETQEQARVRYAEALHRAGQSAQALSYLREQRFSFPEIEAEAMYWTAAAARRTASPEVFLRHVDALAQKYPRSPWTVRALSDAGDSFLLDNDTAGLKRYYRACFEAGPTDPRASYCHWKVAWACYLERRPEAEDLLVEHIRRYPDSPKASAALYFLGRLAERANQAATAKSYFLFLTSRFPNFYHAALARERLQSPFLARAGSAAETDAMLGSLAWPARDHPRSFEPDAVTKFHLERSRVFRAAALDWLADQELLFGVKSGAQRPVVGLELSRSAARNNRMDVSIRYLKRYSPDYQSLDLAAAPREFWHLLYPLPYWKDIERFSRQRGLDPFLVAGLIRQESEFNPEALSRARAHGLTQVMPATGREIARQLKMPHFTTRKLFHPAVNLDMGTHYLKVLLEAFQGNVEAALASYNGGKTRVMKWLARQEFLEPAEFVESIPLTETRGYVQLVLANADVYRRLYSDPQQLAAVTAASPSRMPALSAAAPPAAKSKAAGGSRRAPARPAQQPAAKVAAVKTPAARKPATPAARKASHRTQPATQRVTRRRTPAKPTP